MHGVSQANILSVCSYFFHSVRASPLNIDRMGSWSCKQMFYKLHKLVAQPSKHYYLLENISSSKFQQSRPFPIPFVNSCHEDLNLHLIYKIFVQDTPLLSSNKNVIMPPAQGPPHMDRERPGCLSLRNIQLLYLRLMRLCAPIILVINITTMRKIVNYFRKMFHYRCLTGS